MLKHSDCSKRLFYVFILKKLQNWSVCRKLQRQNGKKISRYDVITATPPLPPHPLIQVGLQIFSSQSFSSIAAQLQLAPCWLHFLRVHASARIHEVVGMDNDFMCINVGQPISWLYAAQSSVCTSVPGRRHFCIIVNSVAAFLLSITWKKPLAGEYSEDTIPKTHDWRAALLPLLYFGLWLNLLSSHLATVPGPPKGINSLFCRSTEQMSCSRLQIFEVKLALMPRALTILCWGSSWVK